MTLIDDYLAEQQKYEKIYGENTIVLMQVGHFYECYAVDNTKESVNGDNLYKLSDILNIQLTRKNKSIIENSRKNPLMIGVNLFSIDKYIQLLLNNKYTCIIIDQVTEPPDPKRAVTNIYSPGTNIIYNSKGDSNNLMSIYLDCYNDINSKKTGLCVGISIVDVSTGKNLVFETYSRIDDYSRSLDETFRFIQTHDPKEIVIVSSDSSILHKDYLLNYLELNSRVVHFKTKDMINKEYFNLIYQKQFLGKIFSDTGLLSVIEYLDLETKQIGLLSYIILLDFAYSHNENIINKIEIPEIYDENTNLILTNNCINQLNITTHHLNQYNTKYNSVYSVINNCSTSLGRRLLKDRLLNPIIDSSLLEKRYNMVKILTDRNENSEPFWKLLENPLSKITDVERLFRKMGLGLLQPSDFAGLDFSCIYIMDLLNIIKNNKILNDEMRSIMPNDEIYANFNEFISEYNKYFDLEEISKYHLDKINSSFFKEGIYQDIDKLQNSINNGMDIFQCVAKKLSHFIEDNSSTMVKVENNERDGYFLTLTSKRSNILKKRFSNMNYKPLNVLLNNGEKISYNIKDICFKSNTKTAVRIGCEYLKKVSSELILAKYKIGNVCKTHYLDIIQTLYIKYDKTFKAIAKFVSNIDVLKSSAKSACMYGYVKPTIANIFDDESYLHVEGIRHPIIERIQTDYEYITNDLKLDKEQNGILLYGTNAAGKSSLMKAIGINIILAQAGFFVAAKSFNFFPYKYIFTRINNNDNIFKGESSFAVEMGELRSILKRSTENSLVLGDELCAGTESISAQSIFAASVIKLTEKKSNFIFATHLHELCNMEVINNISNLSIYHLKVEYDMESGKLKYDRKLVPGSGPAIYGLEVCKAMNMSPDFLELAQSIRKNIMNIHENLLSTKKSNYNSEIYIDKCMICRENAEDVHHIKFQSCADVNKIIDSHIQKDTKSNLVPLCKSCHDKVHNKNIEIYGYVQTSVGVELEYKILSNIEMKNKSNKRKKYNEEQIEIIRNMSRKISKTMVCKQLENNHKIKISSGTLTKIWNGNY